MIKRRGPPSQRWRTFRVVMPEHCSHGSIRRSNNWLQTALCLRHRSDLVWINVTAHPTAEWVARQITEAFPWNEAPRYMIRDRDCIHGAVVRRRLRAIGIRDKPIALGSPWQSGFVERLIGSIRRECPDHIFVLGEAHLRQVLKSYARYYNERRTHLALDKDAPVSRPVQRTGVVGSLAVLGGLHHHYLRT
jgi:transposase InsO family protein